MDVSILLARIIGVTFTVLYGGFLLNRKFYNYESLSKQPFLLLLSGLIALILGQIILLMHPAWTPDWRSIITFIGWLLTFSGVLRLLAPKSVLKMGHFLSKRPEVVYSLSTICFIIGLYLTYIGYLAL